MRKWLLNGLIELALRRRPIVFGICILLSLVLGGAWLARDSLGIDWNLASIRRLVEDLGVWGPVAMVLLIGFRSPLLLPSQALLIVSGLCVSALRSAVPRAVRVPNYILIIATRA